MVTIYNQGNKVLPFVFQNRRVNFVLGNDNNIFLLPEKKKPSFHWGLRAFRVHYSDEISNRQFIIDFAKVVDLAVK